MPYRLVSPDLRLWFIDDNEDLTPIRALYGLTAEQIANIRQLLNGRVGNGRGDRNDRTERKEAANFMLLDNVKWLKHDAGTEYVPLVGKPKHMFDSVVTPRSDMNFGSKDSMTKLLNGSRAKIGGWRKVSAPRQVYSLGHGSSLVGLQACAALTLTLRAIQSRPYRAYVPWTGAIGRQCRARGIIERIGERIGGQRDGRHGGQRDERRGRGVRVRGGSCSRGGARTRSA